MTGWWQKSCKNYLTAVKKTSEINSEWVLALARRVEALRVQKVLMKARKDSKEFNPIKRHEQMNNTSDRAKSTRRELINCKYCGNSHMIRRWPTYSKRCYDVTRWIILRKQSEANTDRPPKMATDEELFKNCTKTMKWQRQQHRNLMQLNQKSTVTTLHQF